MVIVLQLLCHPPMCWAFPWCIPGRWLQIEGIGESPLDLSGCVSQTNTHSHLSTWNCTSFSVYPKPVMKFHVNVKAFHWVLQKIQNDINRRKVNASRSWWFCVFLGLKIEIILVVSYPSKTQFHLPKHSQTDLFQVFLPLTCPLFW